MKTNYSTCVFVLYMSSGAGQVSQADTCNDSGSGVGKEAISVCQVLVCVDDHCWGCSVHV